MGRMACEGIWMRGIYWTIAAFLCLQFRFTFTVTTVEARNHIQVPQDDVQPRRFDYGHGRNGPAHWTSINPNFTACNNGHFQSPMEITPALMVTDSCLDHELDASYSPEPVAANISINAGYGVEVAVPVNLETGVLVINGTKYLPSQFHFHMPSEHKVLDFSFPMELHLVHMAENDIEKRAVIAWLFVRGEASPFLAQFADKLPSPDSTEETAIDPIRLPKVDQKSYARYTGSLTTPPCTQDIIWTVMLWDFPTISEHQIRQFKAAMPKENARPSMPSHGRKFHINIAG